MSTTDTAARAISAYERFQMALKWMVPQKGSDLHVCVGTGFRIRLKGKLVEPPGNVPMGPADTAAFRRSEEKQLAPVIKASGARVD